MTPRFRLGAAIATVAVAVSILLPAAVGSAADGSGGCPAPTNIAWTGGAKCNFKVKGFPITYRGDVRTAPPGSNSIRVWITPRDYPELVLFECQAGNTRYPSCSGGFPDSSTVIDVLPLPPGAEKPSLDCYVQGTGSGTYSCHSGSNAP